MKTINRNAVVVRPAQPFLDWLRTADPTSIDLALEDLRSEPAVYLLPEAVNDDVALKRLASVCGEIFEEQLDGWWSEPSAWPTRRGFEIFSRWFEWSFHSVVFDLSKQPLRWEDF